MNNILISSAGRRVSLVNYFQKELGELFPYSKVLACDSDPSMSSASRVADESIQVPKCTAPNYISEFLKVCTEREIQIVIPTIDTELLPFATSIDLFRTNDVQIIVSNSNFVKICRDKRLMNEFFLENGIKIPNPINPHDPTIPAFIKPYNGSNSRDLYLVDDKDKISKYLQDNTNLMWLEYLPPEQYREFTIDLYYNRNGVLKCCVPRIRIAVRGGETNKGITQKNPRIIEFVKTHLGIIDGARGCITLQLFQSKLDPCDIYGIEINPRFGGGFPLSYLAGANYPKWIIEEYFLGKEIEFFDNWEDNLLLLRYDSEMTIHDFKYKL